MTSLRENEALAGVGPGTPVGELMRQYWIPAALSTEFVADGDPVRLLLLGEQLIGFRDSTGQVGIMDHRCPHRCASLFFGRNEEGGIRCVYHGWKFDVNGNCVDMANVPPHQDFKHKVHAKSYRTQERAGLIWVFMGDQAKVPALPGLEALGLDGDDLQVSLFQRECNWLQALEGDIDTSHVEFLHGGTRTVEDYAPDDPRRFGAIHRDPEYAVTETEWGVMYGAHRPAEPGDVYWRVAHFLFPFWTMTPAGKFDTYVHARAWVPMDDRHTMAVGIRKKGSRLEDLESVGKGLVVGNEPKLPNTTDWFGRWRLAGNARNDYFIDRAAQKADIYSGITGVTLQDQAMTESMGAIVDRTFEHLAPSDRMIAATRRRILLAAQAQQRDGSRPPASDRPEAFYGARGGYYVAPENVNWIDAYNERLDRARNPKLPTAAE
jgi:phthalate 4,5-dioxygenase oxygenase subunit